MKAKFDYDGKYKKKYYKITSETNKSFNKDLAFKQIIKYLDKKDTLCEFGCGDGSKLIHLAKYVKSACGFDVSKEAISRAKKNNPKGKFFISDSGKIFKDEKFNVTIAIATLEHVENPKIFLEEMIRVTKKGGYIIGYNPNFGSPLCPSPPVIYGRNFLQRVLIVIERLYHYRKYYEKELYRNVSPILDKEWQPDFDTVSEVSLERIVAKYNPRIAYASSFWELKPYMYIPFAILASLRIKPFVYWGFISFFVIKK